MVSSDPKTFRTVLKDYSSNLTGFFRASQEKGREKEAKSQRVAKAAKVPKVLMEKVKEKAIVRARRKERGKDTTMTTNARKVRTLR